MKQLTTKYNFYIGIDCGVNTGIAVWYKPGKAFFDIERTTILAAIAKVKLYCKTNPGQVFVRVEDARLRKWIPFQKNEKAERGRNRGAGSVMRDAQIWEEFLTAEKIPHELVAPKHNKTKTTALYFKQMTGWQGSTNEHSRDAAWLVFGF